MLEIEKLNYAYPDGHQAIRDVNLKIKEGESIALVGANGAGKSSLFKLIIGISDIKEGSIKVEELLVEKKTLKDIRRKVGMVFQNPDDQLFMTKVYDDIAFGPRNELLTEEEVEVRVVSALEQLGITHLRDRMPHRLSGGEKRVIAIATVLAMHPRVILFDEPTSFLDPQARRNVINTLDSLKMTKIIATHDLDMALDICDRVIILHHGSVFADGTVKDILLDEKLLSQCHLELPLCMQKPRVR
ncbi:energy-coupling factor ABC transporter ATP-binding protein [Acetobacterium sp.]|jgi:cobalt/nickel transport system ATP-binding protein|uniref:energy-coupling factor ABC transporter ATP-binding protein n=1 Tax=Acetobacterium sp. TaxID=1872094 RepID=UPI000CC9C350|nr:ABC transporter ATP-binding protein [Acetobacterium sp.]MDO9491209.1 ABC transporter ATP-binding protein [Acetobacterium sp.]PKM72248.1 MAG: cobalt ABC transporter ATP-binding protein [Firmicutes bacterium HGW-Firmicutes-17]